MVLWILAGLALFVALLAVSQARRLGRRLDALNQSYWELRYDYTRLRARIARLDPEPGKDEDELEPAAPAAAPTVSFVPLSSMRKKS